MSERAQALAEQLEQANGELISVVERCSEQDWRKTCQAEGWSVGVTAHHLAVAQEAVTRFVQSLANGQQLPPLTGDMLDQLNAEHARQYANCTKTETLELLRRNGEAAASIVHGLSDEQLSRSAPAALMDGASISTEQLVDGGLIGHVRGHGASIQTAISS